MAIHINHLQYICNILYLVYSVECNFLPCLYDITIKSTNLSSDIT